MARLSNSGNDLRAFIETLSEMDEVRSIDGADWNLEIGALTEISAEQNGPALLFDEIKDYPAGFRVLGLPYAAYKRVALAFGLPYEKNKLELVRLASRKVRSAQPIPPREISRPPVMDNTMTASQVDLLKFPVLRSHASDGGRYLGTGDVLINQDPESGYINMGTYRMQLHEPNLLGLWMSPGQHGKIIAARHWEKGKSCPVVATFGQDPLTFMASNAKIPWGRSELDFVGGLRGRPLDIVKGPITGLPIPAHAEIAIEGEIPPPSEQSRDEGPFGEWTGYYSGGTVGTGEPQPVIRINAVYYRNNPIIEDEAPLWPGAVRVDLNLRAGTAWDQLESAGIQDVTGVCAHTNYIWVVAIRQRYAGHAKQAAHALLACSAAARNGRYIVVVDEDIDPTNLKEVLWAMMTRVDPKTDIEIVENCWSTPLDPRMPPEKKQARDHTNTRAIYYAVRPFAWRDKFPKVSRPARELFDSIVEKYKGIVPFPGV
jgi:4-hydroxy-3-polyprenylbenzoate decarboxylase